MTATTINRTEKSVAGAGYVISFFSDIEVLIGNSANYINNVTKLKIKYNKKITEKTEFDEKDQAIIHIVEAVKSSVFRTYIKFTSLKQKIKEFENLDTDSDKKDAEPTIEKMYEKIRDATIPEIKDIEQYVLKLNRLFVEAIDILNMAQGIYQSAATQPS
jgi:Fe-S-cluster formation regulator IscX/YfhJ